MGSQEKIKGIYLWVFNNLNSLPARPQVTLHTFCSNYGFFPDIGTNTYISDAQGAALG
jgi:hypothetical protein